MSTKFRPAFPGPLSWRVQLVTNAGGRRSQGSGLGRNCFVEFRPVVELPVVLRGMGTSNETRHPSKSHNILFGTWFLPSGVMDVGFSPLCACMLSKGASGISGPTSLFRDEGWRGGGGKGGGSSRRPNREPEHSSPLMYLTLIRWKPFHINFIRTVEIEGH